MNGEWTEYDYQEYLSEDTDANRAFIRKINEFGRPVKWFCGGPSPYAYMRAFWANTDHNREYYAFIVTIYDDQGSVDDYYGVAVYDYESDGFAYFFCEYGGTEYDRKRTFSALSSKCDYVARNY